MHLLFYLKICLPSLYNLTQFSPTDQIQPHLFLPIQCADISNFFGRFVSNRQISIESMVDGIPIVMLMGSFLSLYKIFSKIPCCEVLHPFKKIQSKLEQTGAECGSVCFLTFFLIRLVVIVLRGRKVQLSGISP